MKELVDVSVVIPVYNSEKTLFKLVLSLSKLFKELNLTFEIILVDDCSKDQSWKSIVEIANHSKCVKGIQLLENKGQFIATLIGIKFSSGKYILNMDDDFEHPVHEIKKLYFHLENNWNCHVVFGWDKQKYQLKGKVSIAQKLINLFLNFFWNKYPTDSFRIFRREVVFESESFLVNSPMLEIYLKHHIQKFNIGYVNVDFGKRLEGQSGVSFLKKLNLFLKYTPFYISPTSYLVFTALYCSFWIYCSCKGVIPFTNSIVQVFFMISILLIVYFNSKNYKLKIGDANYINIHKNK